MRPKFLANYSAPSLGYPGEVRDVKTIDGLDDHKKKVPFMKRLILQGANDPLVREVAVKQCVDSARPRDYRAQAECLFRFVQNGYYINESHETLQTARYTIEHGMAGDCDDLAIVLGALLESIMIPVKIEVIGWTQKGVFEYRHVYLRVGLPPRAPTAWIAADPTIPQPFGTEPRDVLAKIQGII